MKNKITDEDIKKMVDELLPELMDFFMVDAGRIEGESFEAFYEDIFDIAKKHIITIPEKKKAEAEERASQERADRMFNVLTGLS